MLLTGLAVYLDAQTIGAAQPAKGDASPDDSSDGAPAWVIPTADLNQNLPAWLRFDGAYRNRVERDGGIGFKPRNDNHDLSQLRVMLIIQPTHWLQFVGETQDSRIFCNQNVPSTPPYQNTWDIRQAYVQLGSASDGWFDIVGGREVLSLGEERLIGPSNWLNMGRTFDLVRLNLHHSWFRLSLFASSVIVARDGVISHHIEGNDLHGAYAQSEPRDSARHLGTIRILARGAGQHPVERKCRPRRAGRSDGGRARGGQVARRAGVRRGDGPASRLARSGFHRFLGGPLERGQTARRAAQAPAIRGSQLRQRHQGSDEQNVEHFRPALSFEPRQAGFRRPGGLAQHRTGARGNLGDA